MIIVIALYMSVVYTQNKNQLQNKTENQLKKRQTSKRKLTNHIS